MAYLQSAARRRFESQIKEIVRRLRVADTGKVDPDLRAYAIAAAIFLAHAEIENYFVDALSRLAKLYSGAPQRASRLPGRLRAHLALTRTNARVIVANEFAGKDEEYTLDAVERWFVQNDAACYFNDALPYPALTGQNIYGSYDYPSKKNLARVLRRLGIGDPHGQLNRIAKRDVISLLDSVASLRTALAHNATLPGVSCKDAALRVKGLLPFVAALDRLLYRHAVTTHGQQEWAAFML